PPPPRGRSGRFGLLPPLAMAFTSVKASQLRPDADVPAQGAGEHPALDRAVEARQAAARVGAATRLGSAGDESAVAGREPEQVALRRPPAAAGAAPDGGSRRYSSSGCSTGIPAGTSSGSATSASAATGGCSSASASPVSAPISTSSASVSAGGDRKSVG